MKDEIRPETMMTAVKRTLRYLIYAFPLLFALGCSELGQMGIGRDIYGDPPESEMVGELRSVNARLREMEIRTDDGRTEVVTYDGQTRVVYQGRDYAVANLEAGDYVSMQVRTDSPGSLYTDLVRVRESVQQRGAIGSRGRQFDRVEGRVESIDPRRGEFEIRDDSGKIILVSLPYNPRRSDVDRLQSLRRGDYVSAEGKFLNADRFELEAFV